jgi:hypothetical protein
MAVMPFIPPECSGLYDVLVGQNWPAGDEDALYRCAQAWQDALTQTLELAGYGDSTAEGVGTAIESLSADHFDTFWNQFTQGDNSALISLARQCALQQLALTGQSNEVEYTKLSIDITIVLIAIQIIWALAAAAFTLGGSLAEIPLATFFGQRAVLMLAERFLQMVLMMVLPDVISQGLMLRTGHYSWDGGKTWSAVESGVMAGLLGMVGGAAVAKLPFMGEEFGKTLGGRVVQGLVHFGEGGTVNAVTGITTGLLSGQQLDAAKLWGQFMSGGVLATVFYLPHLAVPHGTPLSFTAGDGSRYQVVLNDRALGQFAGNDHQLPNGFTAPVYNEGGLKIGTATFDGTTVSLDRMLGGSNTVDLTAHGFSLAGHDGSVTSYGFNDQGKPELTSYIQPSDGHVTITASDGSTVTVPEGSMVHYAADGNQFTADQAPTGGTPYRADIVTGDTVKVWQTGTPGQDFQVTGQAVHANPLGLPKFFGLDPAKFYGPDGADGRLLGTASALNGKTSYVDPVGYQQAFGDHYNPSAQNGYTVLGGVPSAPATATAANDPSSPAAVAASQVTGHDAGTLGMPPTMVDGTGSQQEAQDQQNQAAAASVVATTLTAGQIQAAASLDGTGGPQPESPQPGGPQSGQAPAHPQGEVLRALTGQDGAAGRVAGQTGASDPQLEQPPGPEGSQGPVPPGNPPAGPPGPPHAGGAGWNPGDNERELAGRQPRIPPDQFQAPDRGGTESYVASYDASRAIYKPETGVYRTTGETTWIGKSLFSEAWKNSDLWTQVPRDEFRYPRELAAYSTDQMLGFDLVPTTSEGSFDTAGAHGPGSLQAWVPGEGSKPPEAYSPADQQRMAVLDYVTANSDRHGHNYLSGLDGRPVAIDNGETFPATNESGIVSGFVAAWMDRPLSAEVLGPVSTVDPAAFHDMLLARGIGEQAADGAMARLAEIQDHGMITGAAFGGDIHNPGMPRAQPGDNPQGAPGSIVDALKVEIVRAEESGAGHRSAVQAGAELSADRHGQPGAAETHGAAEAHRAAEGPGDRPASPGGGPARYAEIRSAVQQGDHLLVEFSDGERTGYLRVDQVAGHVVLNSASEHGALDENGDLLLRMAGSAQDVPGVLKLFGHADANGFVVDGMHIPFDALAERFAGPPGGDTPGGRLAGLLADATEIHLYGCDAGAGDAVAALAAATGRDVVAADTAVWVDKNGNVLASSETVIDGRPRPTILPEGTGDGTWKVFHPDKSSEILTRDDPRRPAENTPAPEGDLLKLAPGESFDRSTPFGPRSASELGLSQEVRDFAGPSEFDRPDSPQQVTTTTLPYDQERLKVLNRVLGEFAQDAVGDGARRWLTNFFSGESLQHGNYETTLDGQDSSRDRVAEARARYAQERLAEGSALNKLRRSGVAFREFGHIVAEAAAMHDNVYLGDAEPRLGEGGRGRGEIDNLVLHGIPVDAQYGALGRDPGYIVVRSFPGDGSYPRILERVGDYRQSFIDRGRGSTADFDRRYANALLDLIRGDTADPGTAGNAVPRIGQASPHSRALHDLASEVYGQDRYNQFLKKLNSRNPINAFKDTEVGKFVKEAASLAVCNIGLEGARHPENLFTALMTWSLTAKGGIGLDDALGYFNVMGPENAGQIARWADWLNNDRAGARPDSIGGWVTVEPQRYVNGVPDITNSWVASAEEMRRREREIVGLYAESHGLLADLSSAFFGGGSAADVAQGASAQREALRVLIDHLFTSDLGWPPSEDLFRDMQVS